MLIASGKQPPGAAETGVDVQAGAVKGVNAAACQLHRAWLQHADCSGCRTLHPFIIHSCILWCFHAFRHSFMHSVNSSRHVPPIHSCLSCTYLAHHDIIIIIIIIIIIVTVYYCYYYPCMHSFTQQLFNPSFLQHMCCSGAWSVKHPETRQHDTLQSFGPAQRRKASESHTGPDVAGR